MATSTIKYTLAIFSKETYKDVINVQVTDTGFQITATKSGYTPISYSLRYGYSSQIIGGVEQCTMSNGTFFISGFARSASGTAYSNTAITADVWWVKNV